MLGIPTGLLSGSREACREDAWVFYGEESQAHQWPFTSKVQDRTAGADVLSAYSALESLKNKLDQTSLMRPLLMFEAALRGSLRLAAQEEASGPLFVRSVPIHDLNTEALELVEPLQVEIECYPDEVVACVPELDLWVSEDTESEALLAMKVSLREMYQELLSEDDKGLGAFPRMMKRILSKKIRPYAKAEL